MEIIIIRASGSFVQELAKATWNQKEQNKSWTNAALPILLLVVGSITIFICYVAYRMGKPFWSFQSFIGINALTLAILLYIVKYYYKKSYFKRSDKAIEECIRKGDQTEITITDDLICVKSLHSYHELSWPLFKNITITKHHFFLMMDKGFDSGIVVSRNELSGQEAVQLTNFIGVLKTP